MQFKGCDSAQTKEKSRQELKKRKQQKIWSFGGGSPVLLKNAPTYTDKKVYD